MELVDVICNGGKPSQEQLTQLAIAKSVDLSGRNLADLPAPLFSCRALRELLFAGNKLKKLPRETLQLESLTSLYLSHNNLGFLPALHHLPSLTSLHASENRLLDFPLCLPASLLTLDLSRNTISIIPPDVEHLETKEMVGISLCASLTLDLSRNTISIIPQDVEHLVNLQFLNLWSNQITSLPPEISCLTSLTRLWIDGNKIETLPQGLKLLTNLKEFHAFDNPLAPPELLQIAETGTMEAIGGYLEKVYLKECKRVYRTKLIVLGPLCAGKTYLLDHLISRKKPSSDPETTLKKNQANPLATQGAAVRQFTNLYKSKRIVFNIWEFSGDPSYHPAPNLFFHEENVIYLLVYNAVSPGDCKFEKYLEEIRNKAPVAPILVIGTHADLPNFSEKYKEYARPKLEKKCESFHVTAFTEVNAHNASSINEFKALLCKLALESLPTMGELVPPQFNNVLECIKRYKERPVDATIINSLSLSWLDFRQTLDFDFTHHQTKSGPPLLAESRPSAEELKKIARLMNGSGDTIYYGDLNIWDENARLVAILGSRVVHNVQDLLAGVCTVVQQQNRANYVPPPKTARPGSRAATSRAASLQPPPPPPDLSSFIPAIREWLESVKT